MCDTEQPVSRRGGDARRETMTGQSWAIGGNDGIGSFEERF